MSDTKSTDVVVQLQDLKNVHSRSMDSLRESIRILLNWIKDNVPSYMALPCNCKFYPSGDFEQTKPSNPPHSAEQKVILKLEARGMYTVDQLHGFAQLIEEGFLEKLAEQFRSSGNRFDAASQKIQAILKSN